MKNLIRCTTRVISWQESFRTGIAQVDADHRRLFALVRLLSVETVQETLASLTTYAATHFTCEESLMAESRYPDLVEHRHQHAYFAARLAKYVLHSSAWTSDDVEELRSFLNAWLQSHICIHDLAFGRWHAVTTFRATAEPLFKTTWPAAL